MEQQYSQQSLSDNFYQSQTSVNSNEINRSTNKVMKYDKPIQKDGLKNKLKKKRRVKAKYIEYYNGEETETLKSDQSVESSNTQMKQYDKYCSMNDSCMSQENYIKKCCFLVVEKPLDNYKYFMCAGDMMVEFYHEQDTEYSLERRISKYRLSKTVQYAEKLDNSVRLVLNTRPNQIKDFSYLCHLLESKQNQGLYQFSQLLKQYQQFLKICSDYLQTILDYYKNNMSDFELITEIRRSYYIDFIDKKIVSNMDEWEFYSIHQIGPNFTSLAPCIHIFQFSPALLAIFGVDPDTAINISMRGGIREITYYDVKQELYMLHLEKMVQAIQSGHMPNLENLPIKLFTFDNLVIKCTFSSEYIEVPLPSQLEYKSTTGKYKNFDKICLTRYHIEAPEIQKIMQIRKQPEYQQIIKEQMDSIEYNVLSSIFIEKYYSGDKK